MGVKSKYSFRSSSKRFLTVFLPGALIGLPKRQKATGKTKLHYCFHRVVLSCRWLHNLACAILALPTARFMLYDLQKGLNLALFQPGLPRRYTAVIQF